MFHPLTLHGSCGNSSRTRRRRALALRWAGDDVVYQPSAKRMPIHFRHDSKEGGPLRGAAFPVILPRRNSAERSARVQPESPTTHKLLASALQNVVSAARLQLNGTHPAAHRQTWTTPAEVKPSEDR